MMDYEISKVFRRSFNFLRVRSRPDASFNNDNVIYIILREDYEGSVLKVRTEHGFSDPNWFNVVEVRRPNGSKVTWASGWVMRAYQGCRTLDPKTHRSCPPHDDQPGHAAFASILLATSGVAMRACGGPPCDVQPGHAIPVHETQRSCPPHGYQRYGAVFGPPSSITPKGEHYYYRNLMLTVECLKKASNVMVLSGAGMSTAAGIPDFRSPQGLYGTSEQLLGRFTYLNKAEETADWQRQQLRSDVKNALTHRFFRLNPLPYHEMRRGLILGLGENQWKLTIAHVFPEILNRTNKLRMLASQNIDGLDHKVVSDKNKLYNPHGLMSALMSEPIDDCMCMDVADPIYKRYVELVKDNIKDIYADKPTRQGKSSHLWPAPRDSTPITLKMFGNLLPKRFQRAQEAELANGTFSVKPGSVLFDRNLWQSTAAGKKYNVFHDVANCDMLLVMGTSLSGLSIDKVAHIAGEEGKPRAIFDMTTAPIDSIREKGPWVDGKDFFLQGSLDESILRILYELGWLDQLFHFLDDLCLRSLQTFEKFAARRGFAVQEINEAVERETRREEQLYRDE